MGQGHRWQRGLRLAMTVGGLAYLGTWAANRSLVDVQGPSMEPSLRDGDRLITVPALPGLTRPGQVVVVRNPAHPGHLVVKRLAAIRTEGAVVLGDAPERSTDSRAWGAVPRRSVRRIAVARWPDLLTPLTWHADAVRPDAAPTGAGVDPT